ncbi:MAG: hypothetical protein IPK68_22660 [Bdellovibrionales bacterium]|nr:hypothetical protein [Bdellovibrionales bacterium]
MKPLFITPKCHETILRWSLCTSKEINVLCFGQHRHILKVVRIRNVEKFPRYTASANIAEFRDVVNRNDLGLVAEGHNHHGGPSRPSKGDWSALPVGHIELICCCRSHVVSAWKIQKTWRRTISHGRIQLIIKDHR